MRVLILMFLMLNSLLSESQIVFQKEFDGALFNSNASIHSTNDNGYIFTGITSGPTTLSSVLIKTDINGDTSWVRTYGIIGQHNISVDVYQTTDNGYILTGMTGDSMQNLQIIKTNFLGAIIWSKAYHVSGFLRGESLVQTFDGGYVVVGKTEGISKNLYIIRIDVNGNVLWTKICENILNSVKCNIQATDDSAFIVSFNALMDSSNYGFVVLKIDVNGNSLWTKSYDKICSNIIQANDGGYIITGGKSFPMRNKDILLIRTDTVGNIIWTRTYGGAFQDDGSSVEQTLDGGFIISGTTFGTSSDIILLKTDSIGLLEWSKTYGGSDNEGLSSVIEGNDIGYILAGITFVSPYPNYILLIKTDENGNSGCNEGNPLIIQDTAIVVTDSVFNLNSSICVASSILLLEGGGRQVNTLCNSIEVNEFVGPKVFSVYPNPIDIEFTLEGTDPNGIIQISDVSGKIVLTQESSFGITKISCIEMSQGLYFLNYRNGNENLNLKILK